MPDRRPHVLTVSALLVAALSATVSAAGFKKLLLKKGAFKQEAAEVTFSYTARPTERLPRGLKAVAVLDAETTDDAEKKWSDMAADMIAGLLDEAARKGQTDLAVADRKNLKKVLAEKDLAAAGIVEANDAVRVAKVLGVQGLIISSIAVKVEKHTGTGQTVTVKPKGFLRRRRGRSGPVQAKEVEKVTRNITIQCKFRLLDAANGKVLVDYVSPILSRTDKTRTKPFWGASKSEADLKPRDYIVGEVVEGQVRRFIGRYFPIEIRETVEVHSSRNEACKSGVRFLAAGEYDQALAMFRQVVSARAQGQDRYAWFGVGVACEAKGRLPEALDHYLKAVALDAPGAEEAVKRVKARMKAAGGPHAPAR